MKLDRSKRNWVCLLTKDANILSKYLIVEGINTGPKFITKDWKSPKNSLYIWKNGENKLYYPKDDLQYYDGVLSQIALKDVSWPQRFIKLSEKRCKINANKIKEIRFDNANLVEPFKEFCAYFSGVAETIIMTMRYIQEEVIDWISTKTKEDPHQILAKLTVPQDISIIGKEELSRINILKHILASYSDLFKREPKLILKGLDENKELKGFLLRHLELYAWIPVNFEKEPWDVQYLVNNLKELIKEGYDYNKREQEISNLSKEAAKEKEQLLEKFSPPKRISVLIDLLAADAYVRFFRASYFSLAFFNAFPLLIEVGKIVGVTRNAIKNYTPPEIIDALENKKKLSEEDGLNRKEAFAILNIKGKITIYSGEEALELIKKEISEDLVEESDHVKGRCAYPGKVTGKAKIVTVNKETHHIQRGEVMVAKETNPDLVVLMEKAAAIVTDEGGITSHAAIVSREMKKPCIIGTHHATKIFKDGDILEVDADKGVVRKVK